MTSSGTAVVTLPTDTQILITREFAAPKHLVYKAWTTPELIKRWWTRSGARSRSADVDLRVGGKWRYVMVADDGSRSGSTASTGRSSPTSASSTPRCTKASPCPKVETTCQR